MGERNRLYIGNLPSNFENRDLEDWLDCNGAVTDVDVKRGRESGYTYAFVTLDKESDAESLIERKHRTEFKGSMVNVEWSNGSGKRPRFDNDRGGGGGGDRNERVRIYVTGLPSTCSWQDLKDIFRNLPGDVGFVRVDSRFAQDEALGILDYVRQEDAEEAVKRINGQTFEGQSGSTTMTVSLDPPPNYTPRFDSNHGGRGGRDRDRFDDKRHGRDNHRGGGRRDDRDRFDRGDRYDRGGDRGGGYGRDRSRSNSRDRYDRRDRDRDYDRRDNRRDDRRDDRRGGDDYYRGRD